MIPTKTVIRAKRTVEHIGDVQLPHWSSLLFWTLGVLVMCGLTIKYLLPIFHNYYDENENVAVKIGVEDNFSETYFPSMHLCLPGLDQSRSKDLIKRLKARNKTDCGDLCREIDENSLNFWTGTNLSRIDLDFTKLVIDKLFSNLTQIHFRAEYYDSLSNKSSDWQLPIFEQIILFFKLLHLGDQDYFVSGRVEELMVWPDYVIREGRAWRFLLRDDRQLDDLFERVAEFFCFFLSMGPLDVIRIGRLTSERCVDYVKRTGSIIGSNIGDPQFCIPMPVYGTSGLNITASFETPGSETLPPGTIRMGSQYSYFDIRSIDQYAKFGSVCIHKDTPIFRELDPKAFFPVLYCSKDSQLESVSNKYTLQSTVHERRATIRNRCYNEKYKQDCSVRCKMERIQAECNCVPFAARSMIADRGNATYCNQVKYEACGSRAYRRFNECDSVCAHACQYDIFQWFIASDTTDRNGFEITVDPFITSYLRFNVSNRDGIEDLISQVGGLFNFYLGWSGLSLIFAFVFAWDCYRRWKAASKEARDAAGGSGSALNMTMQWRWLIASGSDHSQVQMLMARVKQLEDNFRQMKESHQRCTCDAGFKGHTEACL